MDSYPLNSIDKLIAQTVGHKVFSLVDGYYGNKQILLAKEDQDKLSFITEDGLYCYSIMPFKLKKYHCNIPTTG